MNRDPILTAVVPIGNLFGNYTNIKSWLPQVRDYEITLIVIVSTEYPETCQEIERILAEADIDGKYELVFGSYRNPGISRNAGLSKITTKWVAFWDADDIPDLENVMAAISSEEFEEKDFIIGSFSIVDSNSKIRRNIINTEVNEVDEKKLSRNPGLWRWVFKREFISGVTFPENRMGEDQVFLARTKFWTKEIQFSKEVFYEYYVNHKGQLTTDVDAIHDLMKSLEILMELEKVEKSFFLRSICLKVIMTILRKSNPQNKLKAVIIFFRLIRKNGLSDTRRIFKALLIDRG